MQQNVLLILNTNVICTLLILSMLTELFHKYCTAFYGSNVLPMFNSCTEEIYIVWRVAIHRVWRVPWTTHCKLLPHLANCKDI